MSKNKEAIELSLIGIDDKDEYEKIREFGHKQFFVFRRSFPSIPADEEFVDEIVSKALSKAIFTYNPNMGAAFQTHFYTKLKGEITIYIKKSETTQNYAQKLISNGDLVVKYTDEGFESESISPKTTDEEIEEEEEYQRRLSATLMSKAELPMKLQRVMYAVLEYDKVRDAAEILNMEPTEIKSFRNRALSLILKKVLRSSHLTDEERESMKKEYHLI